MSSRQCREFAGCNAARGGRRRRSSPSWQNAAICRRAASAQDAIVHIDFTIARPGTFIVVHVCRAMQEPSAEDTLERSAKGARGNRVATTV